MLHCVFHNISDLKEAQLEMDHLINSIPGGIASYRIEGERFIPTFYSDGWWPCLVTPGGIRRLSNRMPWMSFMAQTGIE